MEFCVNERKANYISETTMKTAEQLQRDVLAELTWEPGIHASEIGVTTKDGVVTLTGTVANLSQKLLTERATKRVLGVKAVANDIRVGGAATLHSDADIATAVLHALKMGHNGSGGIDHGDCPRRLGNARRNRRMAVPEGGSRKRYPQSRWSAPRH